MLKRISTVFPRSTQREKFDVDIPELCPHCGQYMHPELLEAFILDPDYRTVYNIIALFRCTAPSCGKYFPIQYTRGHTNLAFRDIIKYSYRPLISVNLPENIEKVSPTFVEIYNEAYQAEENGLKHVAGVGYRKAAEFLIKDYVIAKNPDQEEQVKNMFLGGVITQYLSDFPKVQYLAKAVAWLGNDETHYVRKHDDKDLQHLKKFILSSAQFIAADYDADEALEFTSSDNP